VTLEARAEAGWILPGRMSEALRRGGTFAGPGFLVAVGYVDPGNWGTDLAAGSQRGYQLLWVLVVAGVVAIFLQHLAAKVGIASGRDLAQLTSDMLGPRWRRPYWLLIEVAMLATEVAEFLGLVVALRLLFGLSSTASVLIGVVVVLAVLATAGRGNRRAETLVMALLGLLAVTLVAQLVLVQPGGEALGGLAPGRGLEGSGILLAAGIVGATVMPHNLFLHSAAIQSRRTGGPPGAVLRRSSIETGVALNVAMGLNAAMLITGAAVFARHGMTVETLDEAHRNLGPMVGRASAGLFAVGLLTSGLASSLTGGLAGQVVLDGFTDLRIPVAGRRALTLVPAATLLLLGVGELTALLLSQVVLCATLPVVVWSLLRLSNDRSVMGPFVNRRAARLGGRGILAVLALLDAWLVWSVLS
jgi:manganese transport protein